MTDLTYAVLERTQLGDALRGDSRPGESSWIDGSPPRLARGDALVIWAGRSARPSAIVVADNDREELFAWAATFQGDLTPLSSWCQVLSPDDVQRRALEQPLAPEYFGMEAAWTAAMLAEAMELSGRSYDTLSLSALLATEAFAIGRTAGLYGAKAAASAGDRIEKVRRQIRPATEVRQRAGAAVRAVLLSLMPDGSRTLAGQLRILRDLCVELQRDFPKEVEPFLTRSDLRELVAYAPILAPLYDLNNMPAEERVRYLRHLQDRMPSPEAENWDLYCFAAGYVISRVGGAERDLRLADGFGDGRADVLAWAAVTGSLGARTFWTDAFGGLGRFAARELVRPVHFLDPPNCDISVDEIVVVDERSARARLRSANRNAVVVSLLPGVTISFGIADQERPPGRIEPPREISGAMAYLSEADLDVLAQRLAPRLGQYLKVEQRNQTKGRRSSSSSPRLPFRE